MEEPDDVSSYEDDSLESDGEEQASRVCLLIFICQDFCFEGQGRRLCARRQARIVKWRADLGRKPTKTLYLDLGCTRAQSLMC